MTILPAEMFDVDAMRALDNDKVDVVVSQDPLWEDETWCNVFVKNVELREAIANKMGGFIDNDGCFDYPPICIEVTVYEAIARIENCDI